LRDDLLRPAGHRAGPAADRGHRPADGPGHRADRGAGRARPGPQGHAAGGPHARHPRGAGRVGAPGGGLRVRAAPRHPAAGPGPGRGRGGQAVRAGRQLLQHRPGHRAGGHGRPGPAARGRGHPGRAPRRHRRVGERARDPGHGLRGGRARGAARAADRGRRAGRGVRRGAEGSSAMPHKRNPVRSERICGLARIARAQLVPVMEGIPLWHERDISHSSTERVALPDVAIVTDYLLAETTALITGLVVDGARMRANLDSTRGLIYTSAVLLVLVADGMSREDAYALVQAAAMETWAAGTPLRDTLRAHAARQGQPLDEARLDEACRPGRYTERLGGVFARVEALAASLAPGSAPGPG